MRSQRIGHEFESHHLHQRAVPASKNGACAQKTGSRHAMGAFNVMRFFFTSGKLPHPKIGECAQKTESRHAMGAFMRSTSFFCGNLPKNGKNLIVGSVQYEV